jgi:hypothetical protein
MAQTLGEPRKRHQLVEKPNKLLDSESYATLPPPQIHSRPSPPPLPRLSPATSAESQSSQPPPSLTPARRREKPSTERRHLVCFGSPRAARAFGSRGGPRVRPHPSCEYPSVSDHIDFPIASHVDLSCRLYYFRALVCYYMRNRRECHLYQIVHRR